MILHPGILALLLGSLLTLAAVLVCAWIAIQVLRYWAPDRADQRQLSLERRTYLVSTLVNYALAFSILSLPLFLFTVDDLHPLFVGAMCATGSLNANPIGWTALFNKMLLVFFAGLWVVVNHYDLQSEDYPLTKIKSLALLILVPLLVADFLLQAWYFLGLTPEIITSCCGSLFSSGSSGLAAEVSSFPLKQMMMVFYAGLAAYLLLLVINLVSLRRLWRDLLAISALLLLFLGLAGTVSFISLYVYELPSHHCPFDMLQASSHFIGYPIYLGLFGTVLCSLVPSILERLGSFPGLVDVVAGARRRWLWSSLIFFVVFVLLTSWPVLFGRLSLRAFF